MPQEIIDDLHRAYANLWWGKSKHWIRWDKLCEVKEHGGLNFRNMGIFNDALLAKQVWRLWKLDSPILSELYKAKYHPQESILDVHLGSSPSMAWHNFWGATSLLKDGLIWKISNGDSVNIWLDNWLPGEGRRAPNNTHNNTLELHTVNQLIDHTTKTWKTELITSSFDPEDAERILAIALSDKLPEDNLVWGWTKFGNYLVKSGYWLGMNRDPNPSHEVWNIIWHSNTIPIIKIFLWRACSEILPTKGNLVSRHIGTNPMCPMCNQEVEQLTICSFPAIR